MKTPIHIPQFILIAALALALTTPLVAEIFLPGMQPTEADIEFAKVQQCRMCHAGTPNGAADPFLSWQSGMMSQAMRDPVFRASLTIANQDIPESGEFCLRCHAPRGWLEDRSTPGDASALNPEDLHGVSCDVCHRLIDPLSPAAAKMIKDVPPSYGNAMMVADPTNTVHGPYGDGAGAMPHHTNKSEYHASSKLCATCHNISNPTQAQDVRTQSVHSFGHIERTYSEWLLSDFAQEGKDGTCQSCHYRPVEGGGQASRFGGARRDHFVMHGPVGGSVWQHDATWLAWQGQQMSKDARDLGKQRAQEFLKEAATLELTFPKAGQARLRITNKTGHKLPSGYPEGRRMWVQAKFYDASGALLQEIGRYALKQERLFDQDVEVPTLLDPDQTTVYECLPGISPAQAAKFDKAPGKSFHFVLNDVILKDNRIPPRGFKNETFAAHLSQPVGATYADGQHWDDMDLKLPAECVRIQVALMYQSVTWDYIKFLAEENRTDDWGRRLYDIWQKTGQCPPVIMATLDKGIPKP
ncbi:multiheme c-type cytochrome [Planctomycetota bacterium]